MKLKKLNLGGILAILFFIIVNTGYFWEPLIGFWSIFTFIILAIIFLIIVAFTLGQFLKSFEEKFQRFQRNVNLIILVLVLVLTICFPRGIIDFERVYGNDVLIATREGAANCTMTFRLKDNKVFTQTSICFGINRASGTYEKRGDTIFFNYKRLGGLGKRFKYGILEIEANSDPIENFMGKLILYETQIDTIPFPVYVTKYKM